MNDDPNKPKPALTAAGTPSVPGGPGAIPRGLEVLLKKAAIDPEFRVLLLEQRAGAAAAIELDLTPAETAMVNAIPADQLKQLIANTTVPSEQRRVFLGRTAAAMLLAIGAGAVLLPMCARAKSRGISPDRPRRGEIPTAPTNRQGNAQAQPTTGTAALEPDPPLYRPSRSDSVTLGSRPDRP